MALLHHFPVQSSEQAVTLEEGQEIVGTDMSPQPRPHPEEISFHRATWRTLWAAMVGKRNQRGSWRTMKKWMWHCCSAIGLGGNSKVCCTGVGAWLSKTHWQKTRPSSHGDLSHAAARVVYLYFSCRTVSPFTRTLRVCVCLSLWTCFGCCYFELDLGFIQAFQLQRYNIYEVIYIWVGVGPCRK